MKDQVSGKFDVILADPPWKYMSPQTGKQKGMSPEDHYPVMTATDICKLQIPSYDNAVLFLWVPVYIMEKMGLRVMKAWGFKYKSMFVWEKTGDMDKTNLSTYFRLVHEILLFGTRGKALRPAWADRPVSVLHGKRGRHSEKPKIVHKLIEKMYPGRRYLELFAREPKENWVVWGNEV